jgi:hypothetical protein
METALFIWGLVIATTLVVFLGILIFIIVSVAADGRKAKREGNIRCSVKQYRQEHEMPPAPPPPCDAVQRSDQMVCHTCEQLWDVNDPAPPNCDPALKGHRV